MSLTAIYPTPHRLKNAEDELIRELEFQRDNPSRLPNHMAGIWTLERISVETCAMDNVPNRVWRKDMTTFIPVAVSPSGELSVDDSIPAIRTRGYRSWFEVTP